MHVLHVIHYMVLNFSQYDIIFVAESLLHSDFSHSLLIPNSFYTAFRGDGLIKGLFMLTLILYYYYPYNALFLICLLKITYACASYVFTIHLHWQMTLTTLLQFFPYWTNIQTQKGVCFVSVTSIIHINWRVPISFGSVAHNFFTCTVIYKFLIALLMAQIVFASNPCQNLA